MDLGNTITQLRKKTGISRNELAATVGISGAIIGRYKCSKITPSAEVAAKITEAFEVSLDYLVGNTTVLVKDKKCSTGWSCLRRLLMLTEKLYLRSLTPSL